MSTKKSINFELVPFEVNPEKGLVNITEMAKPFGKRAPDWQRLDSTKKLIAAYQEIYPTVQICTVKEGINGGGTWVIKELAIDFAHWLDVNFKVYCLGKLNQLLTTGNASINSSNLTQQAMDVARCSLGISELFGIPLHKAQIEAVKDVRKATGIDISDKLALAPAQQNIAIESEMYQPTDLFFKLFPDTPITNKNTAGKVMNKKLEELGLQKRDASGKYWETTEKGRRYSSKQSCTNGSWSGYNLCWRYSEIKAILDRKIGNA